MEKMNYEEACFYIEETPKFTQKHSLSHTRECLRRLGNPERSFRVIHVAGTNGKGSTCAFLFSILRAAGYHCGLFTSPHLVDIRERFQVDEAMVGKEEFLKAFHEVLLLAQSLEDEGAGHPTYFEMLFLMGMLIFRDRHTELVVLETGLGGRLDATTAVPAPLACVITSVSLDHMQYLGSSVEEIAAEKAGIIVPGVPVIFDSNNERTAAVIRKKASDAGCAWIGTYGSDCVILKKSPAGIDFLWKNRYYENIKLHMPFIAEYQVDNAALALRTIETLAGDGIIKVDAGDLQRGISSVRWPGRMERILPGVFLDGAHNEDGIRRFVETAEQFHKDGPVGLLFSAVNDKNYREMIRYICSRLRPDFVAASQVGGPRQVPASVLAEDFRQMGCRDVYAFSDPVQAFWFAVENKKEEGVLFCAGSLYLAGIIMKALRRSNPAGDGAESEGRSWQDT